MHKTILIAVVMLLLVLSVVLSPNLALQASLSGISIWWNLVFPGLLPFFILYEFMLAFGLLHGLNTLLSPLMTRLLRLPPTAGIPMLMSISSGFPTGVEPAMKLVQDRQLSLRQVKRLLYYIHFPNPIFIIVIIGAGVFKLPHYGYIILISIWMAALLLMLLHTFWSKESSHSSGKPAKHKLYFSEAMRHAQQLDGRSFGQVLGDSVYSSVQKLFIIGGFIIFASVIAAFIEPIVSKVLPSVPFIEKALLEQHIGSFAIADWANNQQHVVLALALIAACLSFTGVSGLLQVSYYCSPGSISMPSFLGYRALHAVVSFTLLLLLWRPLNSLFSYILDVPDEPAFLHQPVQSLATMQVNLWLPSMLLSLALAGLVLITHLWHTRSIK